MRELQTWILRANALFLMAGSLGGLLVMDIPALIGRGPAGAVLGHAPYLAIGFLEAHGLAFIIAILLWTAEPLRRWHFTAIGTELILGISNLICWQLFVATGTLAMGYITTSLHWIFVALQLVAASASMARRSATGASFAN